VEEVKLARFQVAGIAAAGLMLLSTSCFAEADGLLQVQQVCGVTIAAGATMTLKPAKHGHEMHLKSDDDAKFNFINVPDGLYYLTVIFPLEKGRFMVPGHNKFPIAVVGSKTDVECTRPLVVGLSSGAKSDLSVNFQK
jgi:hypothetical protein